MVRLELCAVDTCALPVACKDCVLGTTLVTDFTSVTDFGSDTFCLSHIDVVDRYRLVRDVEGFSRKLQSKTFMRFGERLHLLVLSNDSSRIRSDFVANID